jgi:hypothetical protein
MSFCRQGIQIYEIFESRSVCDDARRGKKIADVTIRQHVGVGEIFGLAGVYKPQFRVR